MQEERQETFKRNEKLELLLKEINSVLESAEKKLLQNFLAPKYPTILIIGAPRSGTTLILQWLARTGYCAYPSNLLSRFYGAPCIGAKIQQLLTAPEYNFRDEILDFTGELSFESDLGKTKGALAPNEFWYFWRRFIPNTEPQYLDEAALKLINSKKFLAELAAIEAVFDKPFAMKGMILQFNIEFLNNIFDKVLFLFIRRHPFYNIQSLLKARVSFYGDMKKWYSVKPVEYEALKELSPYEQVAGQVYFTNRAIENGLKRIDPKRYLQLGYEEFCINTKGAFDSIVYKFAQQDFRRNVTYVGPQMFGVRNEIQFSEEDCNNIREAYKKISRMDVDI
jgi:hypothetical protein